MKNNCFKRTLAILIAISVCMGFIPASALDASGIKIVYDLQVASLANGVAMTSENASYSETNGFWAMDATFGTVTVQRNTINGTQVLPNANAWWSMRVQIPKAGSYSLELSSYTKTTNAGLVTAYFGPAASGAPAIAGGTAVGSIDTYGATTSRGNSASFGSVEATEAGEYIIVFKADNSPQKSGARRQYIKTITLNGGGGAALISAVASPAAVELGIDETAVISVTKAFMSDGTEASEFEVGAFTSDDTGVASVNAQSGTVTGVTAGTAKITATVTVGEWQATASAKITVVAPPPLESVALSFAANPLKRGKRTTATALAVLTGGAVAKLPSGALTFSTEDTDIISIDSETGVILGLAEGTAEVTASVTLRDVTKSDTKTIEILPSTLERSDVTIKYDLRGTLPQGAHVFNMTYDDSNGFWSFGRAYNIDEYGSSGAISRLRTNKLLGIQAQPNEIGSWWALKLYVPKAGIYSLEIEHSSAVAGGMSNVYFVPASTQESEWVTAANKVGSFCCYSATSRYGGVIAPMADIEADAEGEYYIIFEPSAKGDGAGNGTGIQQFPLFVKLIGGDGSAMMRTGMTLSDTDIYVGGSALITIGDVFMSDGTAVPLSGADITYTSGDSQVASVTEDGVVTGVAAGVTDITARLAFRSGIVRTVTQSVSVTVPPDLASVEAQVANAELECFSSAQITVTGTNADMSATQIDKTEVTYESDNNDIASADANGIIKAKTPGTATITVTVRQNGIEKSDTIEITVIPSKDEENVMPLSGTMLTYDFVGTYASGQNVFDIGFSGTGDTWAFEKVYNITEYGSNGTIPRLRVYPPYGIQAQPDAIGSWWALRLKIPTAGRYSVGLQYGATSGGGIGEIFIAPADAADPTLEAYSVGTVDFYSAASTSNLQATLAETEISTAGEYVVVFKSTSAGTGAGRQQFPYALTLDGTGVISYVDAFLDKDVLDVGETTRLFYRIKGSDGRWLGSDDAEIVYTSSDSAIASIDAAGTVTAHSEGSVVITLMATAAGKTIKTEKKLTVNDSSTPKAILLTAPNGIYISGTGRFAQRVLTASGGTIEIASEAVTYEKTGGDGDVEIALDGTITGTREGTVEIRARASFRGVDIESEITSFTVLPRLEKTGRTLFTDEMCENARENIKKYGWAKSELDLYLKRADMAVENPETVYNFIIPEGIPRAMFLGMNSADPNYSYCRYCKTNLQQEFGSPYFSVAPYSKPWKVQCPKCKRQFPSNNFAKFYELGLDEHGAFDVEKAHSENDKIIADGGKGYLTNELYPEVGAVLGISEEQAAVWGVDDSRGYYTGKVYGNGTPEVHPYIANYYFRGPIPEAYLAIRDLAFVYMYTGEAKYGRVGAALLDRMADVSPGMSTGQYPFLVNDGGAGIGKMIGALGDCTIFRILAQACDAFYPLCDDPQVISYLSAKSEKFKLDNPKLSGSDIWGNWADGILRETYKCCKNTTFRGGFGHKQEALGTAAVALDSMPESKEMLDWIFNPGEEDKANLVCNGGNINVQLVDVLDRDGSGDHGSPNYNATWIDFLMPPVQAMDGYEKYTDNNLFENPKFVKMFTSYVPFTLVSKYTAQFGDAGYTGSVNFTGPELDNLIYAYEHIEDDNLAKLIYLQSGMNYDAIHSDVMTKNPTEVADKIKSVIERDGFLLPSEMMTGTGFAVMRDGEYIESVGTQGEYDTQRDFWMYFGLSSGHGHFGTLNLGMEAYGFNFAPDFGYPESAVSDAPRRWLDGTLAHNTVMVNAKDQLGIPSSQGAQHFDAGNGVSVMDVDSPDVYAETRTYRRTVVMVNVSDEISYGVDFFKVLGGNDHIYSFRAHSDSIFATEGLDSIEAQVDENGEYVGTYAGRDTTYCVDPGYEQTGKAIYPIGFPFLKNVRSDKSADGNFAVDFAIRDFQSVLPYPMNLHLRMTALNDFAPDEVAITSAYVPRRLTAARYYDTLEQVLIRRKSSASLNSLFTTVYEPYKDSRYISAIDAVEIAPVSGVLNQTEAARAVKVTHTSGRVDYIAYATDKERDYIVRDGEKTFEFRGFIGVLSYMNGKLIYSYIHDGEKFGEAESARARVNGTVRDFTRTLELENKIIIAPSAATSASALTGKYIFVKNDGLQTGAYRILGAESLENGDISLDIGGVSVIRAYRNSDFLEDGFIYNIAAGQNFEIPLTAEELSAPIFEAIAEKTVSAGSNVQVTVSATSPIGAAVTYAAGILPRGASFDAQTASFKWKPDSSQVGQNHVAIDAIDEYGRRTTAHFTVKVLGATSGGGGASGGGGGTGSTDDTAKPEEPVTPENPELPEEPNKPDTTPPASEVFSDLDGYDWARGAIEALAEDEVIKGTSATTFTPGAEVTRADFAILLVRAFGITGGGENFADVSQGDYFADELAAAKGAGLINGIGDNCYAPRRGISREDMMVIICRALSILGYTLDGTGNTNFDDSDEISAYAADAVKALAASGLVTGAGGKLNPKKNTTRAEVAVLIERILEFTAGR